jgi:hypothetical protein
LKISISSSEGLTVAERPVKKGLIAAGLLHLFRQILVVNLQESANTPVKRRRITFTEKRHVFRRKFASGVQAYLVNHTPEMHQATDKFIRPAQTLNSWHASTFLAL